MELFVTQVTITPFQYTLNILTKDVKNIWSKVLNPLGQHCWVLYINHPYDFLREYLWLVKNCTSLPKLSYWNHNVRKNLRVDWCKQVYDFKMAEFSSGKGYSYLKICENRCICCTRLKDQEKIIFPFKRAYFILAYKFH